MNKYSRHLLSSVVDIRASRLLISGVEQVSNLAQRFDVTDLTAVQIKAIPHVLAGRDVMIKSQTGSGAMSFLASR